MSAPDDRRGSAPEMSSRAILTEVLSGCELGDRFPLSAFNGAWNKTAFTNHTNEETLFGGRPYARWPDAGRSIRVVPGQPTWAQLNSPADEQRFLLGRRPMPFWMPRESEQQHLLYAGEVELWNHLTETNGKFRSLYAGKMTVPEDEAFDFQVGGFMLNTAQVGLEIDAYLVNEDDGIIIVVEAKNNTQIRETHQRQLALPSWLAQQRVKDQGYEVRSYFFVSRSRLWSADEGPLAVADEVVWDLYEWSYPVVNRQRNLGDARELRSLKVRLQHEPGRGPTTIGGAG